MRAATALTILLLAGCGGPGAETAPIDASPASRDVAVDDTIIVGDDAADAAETTPALPTIAAAIEPVVPTRATGVSAKVTLTGAAGWTPHFRWVGPRMVADDQVKNSAIERGESWTLEAWATDGSGARIEAKPVPFTVGNSLPGVATLAIEPAAPQHGDGLSAKVVAAPIDADGDALTLEWAWDRDGAATSYTSDTIASGVTIGKETWRVRVRAHETADPTQLGAEASATVIIGLAPPTAPVVAIEPAAPDVGAALLARIVTPATDPKGESLTYSYRWSRDSVMTATTTATVSGAEVGPHQVWRVEVRAKNSALEGPPGIATATVKNRAPVVDSVTLAPTTATGANPITATWVGSDPDGDAVTASFRWFKGTSEIASATTATLAAGTVKRGEVVTCEVTLTDSFGAKSTRTSAGLTIANTAPPVPTARFDPPYPRGTESASIVANAVDADGDAVSYVVEWMLNDVPQPGVTSLARSNAELARGVWTARVAATDGTTTSAFVPVAGTLTLCPARSALPVSSSRSFGRDHGAAWDARSCSYLFGSSYSIWEGARAQSIDPVTFEELSPPSVPYRSDVRYWNPRAFLHPTSTLDLPAATVTLGYDYLYGSSIGRESWAPYTHTVDLPPYPYTKGEIVAKAIDFDATNGIASFTLFDGETVAKTRVLTLIRAKFPNNDPMLPPVAPPTMVNVTVPSGAKFPDAMYAPAAYHPASEELLIGPIGLYSSDPQIWGINVRTGVARVVSTHAGLRPTPWRYDHWSRTFVALIPLAGHGAGSMDPVTGAVTWTAPARGFGLQAFFGGAVWPTITYGPAARNPNGDHAVPLGRAGVLHFRANDKALREPVGPLPHALWQTGDRPEHYDTLARTTTGTVIIVPMNAHGTQVSMARIFELDPATGAVAWLAPASDSELPNWIRYPSAAYDDTTDSLYLHGGDHEDSGTSLPDTWRFQLTTRKWTRLSTSGPPRIYGSLTVDSANNRLLLFGGVAGPHWPEPSWRPELWAFNLSTNAWSLIDSSGPSFRAATISLDTAGTSLHVLGYRWYYCMFTCPPTAHVFSFDLATKSWSAGANVPMAFTPVSYVAGATNYHKMMLARGAPSKRAFVFGGRGCNDPTGSDSGLLALSWDSPTTGWTYAVRDTTSILGYPSLSWDDTRKRAYAMWSRDVGGSWCASPRSGTYTDTAWFWP